MKVQNDGPVTLADLTSEVDFLEPGALTPVGRYVLVASRWNPSIVEPLIQGAVETLLEAGLQGSSILLLRVPGAFEIPQAVGAVLRQVPDLGAVVTLGCVIRGETPHFEYVAGECARGVAALARKSEVPVVLGVLTTDNLQQAQARSVPGTHNKGREAASAALELQQAMQLLKGAR